MNAIALPNIANAKTPQTYANAKSALSSCISIDECKSWADKAAALASYAKMANDESLMDMAARIRGRAIRRAGELLQQIEARKGANQNIGTATDTKVLTRKDAAEQAGMSKRQAVTAVRVANVPAKEFEAAIESEKPATVTKLAAMGTKQYEPMADTIARMVAGRSEEEYERCRELSAAANSYSRNLAEVDLDKTIPVLTESERADLREKIALIDSIHDKLITRI